MSVLLIGNQAYKGNINCFDNLIDIYGFKPNGYNTLSFSHFKDVRPFNSLIISLTLKDIIEKTKQENKQITLIEPNDSNINGYLTYLGFYETCGFDDKKGGSKSKPGAYICINKLNFDYGGSQELDYCKLEEQAMHLAKMLKFDKELSAYSEYCFFEMIRNVYEHAQTKEVYVCAQFWPNLQEVEIAIADKGCGINTAMKNRFFDKTEKERLFLAMKPGISAMTNHCFFKGNDNYYSNSGYGLYITKELAIAYGGLFTILSGNHAIRYSEKGILEYKTKYQGTAIGISFSTNTTNNFEKTIKRIKEKGELEAGEIRGAIKRASKSSGGMQWF